MVDGNEYQFRLFYRAGGAESAASNIATVTLGLVLPDYVRNLTATLIPPARPEHIRLDWRPPPADSSFFAVTGYEVREFMNPGDPWTTVTMPTRTFGVAMRPLAEGEHEFHVRAISDGGIGPTTEITVRITAGGTPEIESPAARNPSPTRPFPAPITPTHPRPITPPPMNHILPRVLHGIQRGIFNRIQQRQREDGRWE